MPFELERTYGLRADYWYRLQNLSPNTTQQRFFESSPDNETQKFLDKSNEISNSFIWQTIRNLGTKMLSPIYPKTDVIGILGSGNMFLFSEQQLSKFIGIDKSNWDATNKTVLDLGAGNGNITEYMRGFYNKVYATELSPKMRNRLTSKGYTILDALEWANVEGIRFDLITAFNLIDRHYSPTTLLDDLYRASTRSNCPVIVSLVLPVIHYVEYNPSGKSTDPDKLMQIYGQTYSEQAHSMIVNVFQPAGFEVVRWTRLPYLCEGETHYPVYYLPDAVFLLKPIKPKPNAFAERPVDVSTPEATSNLNITTLYASIREQSTSDYSSAFESP
ncbi:unnamed protein product [Caenorhabditis brenneri]